MVTVSYNPRASNPGFKITPPPIPQIAPIRDDEKLNNENTTYTIFLQIPLILSNE